jgi:RimJ/RimL family protein N-acetyltransferase
MAKAMTDSIAWMFENTPCVKIVAGIPAYNHFALRLAKSSGMSLEGVNRKSFLKDGVLHDQIYFGINKEGPCPHYSP